MAQERRRAAAQLLQRYHQGAEEVTAEQLDAALGLEPSSGIVASSYDAELEAKHPSESVVYLPTPYPVCRAFLHEVAPSPADVVVDLGCGVGRLLLYGGLVTPARYRGIEIVEVRATAARRAVEQLGLHQVEILCGNVLDLPLDDGTIFYAFRPFSAETEAAVHAALGALAAKRPITIGAYRLPPWLLDSERFECTHRGDLRILRSRPSP